MWRRLSRLQFLLLAASSTSRAFCPSRSVGVKPLPCSVRCMVAAPAINGDLRPLNVPPIVWAIAGSDSGGGAGIQADLQAMHALDCHGCSAVTALTAQNSVGVHAVQPASLEVFRATLDALHQDLTPRAIKTGMLGTAEMVEEVGRFLSTMSRKVPVVCDPVMVSTSGSVLLTEEAKASMVKTVFPQSALITPNRHEAEALVGRPLRTPSEVEAAARELLGMGQCGAVLLKGGHSLFAEAKGGQAEGQDSSVVQDYLSLSGADKGMWITTPRVDTCNTHGTGCTLSSAVASFLAHGLGMADAVVLAKAYVQQGLKTAVQLGKGPGPVRHTHWPCEPDSFPWVTDNVEPRPPSFAPYEHGHMGLYPCVDTSSWVERLVGAGVKDIQLRIKNKPMEEIDAEVRRAQDACTRCGARLWVNDYWELAVKHRTYGVHMGQEDLSALLETSSRLNDLRSSNVRLGMSAHSYEELGRALAIWPSYISLGPIFPTGSKKVNFAPQGLRMIERWRKLVAGQLVVIGGIGIEEAPLCVEAGADGVCVISALKDSVDAEVKTTGEEEGCRQAVATWQAACARKR